jgi:hypothetical protein
LTSVDLDGHDPGPNSRTFHVRARHEAVLDDGRRILLLDDRGWGGTMSTVFLEGEPSTEERHRAEAEAGSAWAHMHAEEMRQTARVVVGPDEPWGDETYESVESEHWAWMAEILGKSDVVATGDELKSLPHDVELSDSIMARIEG